MANELTSLKGVIHGKTIELADAPGFPDGSNVTVTLAPANAIEPSVACHQPPRGFGAWAEDAEELDQYLEWNRQQRKISRREIEP